MDAATAAILGVVALQAIQLAQTAVLGRTVRKSMRPPPPPRGTPVIFEDESRGDGDTSPGLPSVRPPRRR